jgi:hypothetical protein
MDEALSPGRSCLVAAVIDDLAGDLRLQGGQTAVALVPRAAPDVAAARPGLEWLLGYAYVGAIIVWNLAAVNLARAPHKLWFQWALAVWLAGLAALMVVCRAHGVRGLAAGRRV